MTASAGLGRLAGVFGPGAPGGRSMGSKLPLYTHAAHANPGRKQQVVGLARGTFLSERQRGRQTLGIRKLFSLRGDEPSYTGVGDSDSRTLRAEYQHIIREQLLLAGIPPSAVALEVRHLSRSESVPVLVGMLQLHAWERQAAFRTMLGLPMLEEKVRRALSGTWLQDVSRFGGLWLHASAQLRGSPAFHELSAVIMHLEDTEPWDEAPPTELGSA